MIYIPREKLTIIELVEDRENVTFEEIERALWDRPSNMIYVENAGELSGIISMGDIERAVMDGKVSVGINADFTSVLPSEYMRAKDIFINYPSINALPIKFRGGSC